MKKILPSRILISILILISIFALSNSKVFAQATASATSTTTPSADKIEKNKQIEDLKERLATKVAELRQTTKKAISGIIKTVSISSITVETNERDIKLELTDDITVVDTTKGTKANKTTEDLTDGAYAVIFGMYDKTLDILTAKHIVIQKKPETFVHGTITTVDNKTYVIGVKTNDNRELTVDFEKTTDAKTWNGSGNSQKIGFSKILSGDKIFVYGIPDVKDAYKISAIRLLTIGTIIPSVTPSEAASPSSTISPSKKP
jgi:hypothetical protein